MKKNLLKTLAVALTTALLIPGIASNAKDVADYSDVPADAWFYSYVADVSGKDLMTGLNDNTFGPGELLGRGQFATVLYRMSGDTETVYAPLFPDVTDGSFFSIPATWARNSEIITGYADGNFGPADNITREQVATILYRYATSTGLDTSNSVGYSCFPDASSVSTFASTAISWAIGSGIIKGDNGNINPQGNVSRAVCATMISRFTDETTLPGFSNGMFKVGVDISAGEYVLVADKDAVGYFEVASDSTYSPTVTITNDLFINNSIVTVTDGQFLLLERCTAYKIDKSPTLDTGGEGMFKVGKDIPAGTYKILPGKDQEGYYSIKRDSLHLHDSLISEELFTGEVEITVENGQYLTLLRSHIVK